jgi:hypothetical protein
VSSSEVISPTRGLVGHLHEIEFTEPTSILIFQLPRKTEQINSEYAKAALDALRPALPEGRKAVVIGCDVNVYEMAGPDAVTLKLKGLI